MAAEDVGQSPNGQQWGGENSATTVGGRWGLLVAWDTMTVNSNLVA